MYRINKKHLEAVCGGGTAYNVDGFEINVAADGSATLGGSAGTAIKVVDICASGGRFTVPPQDNGAEERTIVLPSQALDHCIGLPTP